MLPGPFLPDLTIAEVSPPATHYCASGHIAPLMYRRDGPDSPEEPMRFARVTSTQQPQVNGIYCEPCLIIANALARKKKEKEGKR